MNLSGFKCPNKCFWDKHDHFQRIKDSGREKENGREGGI